MAGAAGTSASGRKAVALLGGSFNPPHVAHLMAAYWTLATQRVREVWLLPSYRHPFGKELARHIQQVVAYENAREIDVRAQLPEVLLDAAMVCVERVHLRVDLLGAPGGGDHRDRCQHHQAAETQSRDQPRPQPQGHLPSRHDPAYVNHGRTRIRQRPEPSAMAGLACRALGGSSANRAFLRPLPDGHRAQSHVYSSNRGCGQGESS